MNLEDRKAKTPIPSSTFSPFHIRPLSGAVSCRFSDVVSDNNNNRTPCPFATTKSQKKHGEIAAPEKKNMCWIEISQQ